MLHHSLMCGAFLSVPRPPGAAGGTDISIKGFIEERGNVPQGNFINIFRNKGKEKEAWKY